MKLRCLSPNSSVINLKKLIMVIFAMTATMAQAQIFDGYLAEAGKGKHAMIYKLGAQKWVANDYSFFTEHNLRPYLELTVSKLIGRRYQATAGRSQSLTDVGFTPVLRWQQNIKQGLFGEIGIGLNYMSDIYNNAGQIAGSKFQFGDHIGVGYQFSNSLEVTLKYQHYSNAGFSHPNPAINFSTIKVAYSF